MSKEFEKLMRLHEDVDKDYINSSEEVKARIKDEFANADEFLMYLEKDEKAARAFFDYSGTKPYRFAVIPVRKSNILYVKKHTATQRPYYHSHSFYELIYVQKGKCEIFIYPDGERLRIERGGLFLCAPSSVHALSRAGKKDVIMKAVIPCKVFEEISFDKDLIGKDGIKVFENTGDKAQTYFQNFVRENSLSESFARIAEKSWLTLFLVELFRDKREKSGDIVEKFEVYTQDNLRCANLKDFAAFAGYNPDYVTRVLKRETGKNFKENVTTIRLSKSKVLLQTTDMSVENIAADVGYQNASGFYKQFTASYGITPAQYRNSQR